MTLVAPFEELYRQAACGLVVTTASGVITEANDTFISWVGTDRDKVIGSKFVRHLDSGSRLFFETRHTPVVALQGETRDVSLTMVRSDGTPMPVLINSAVRGEAGDIHTAVFDASARAEYEKELLTARRVAESSELRVRVLQTSSSTFVSSTTEKEICDTLFSAAFEALGPASGGVWLLGEDRMFTLMAGENPIDGAVPPSEPRPADAALIDDTTITVTVRDVDGPYQVLAKALRARRFDSVSVIPLLREGQPIGVLACFFKRPQEFDNHFIDLQTALARQAAQAIVRVRLQRELERLALHDQLTGLGNRKLLLETVDKAIGRAGITHRPLSLIFLDLDGFKAINDQLGHSAGDSVLEQVAARVRASVREEDVVGRYGGDEFVVVCEDADEEDAASIAERIRLAVASPLDGIPAEHSVTASLGIAVYLASDTSEPLNDELITLADNAMYQAKTSGKNRAVFLHL